MSPEKAAATQNGNPMGDGLTLAPLQEALRQTFSQRALEDINPVLSGINSAQNNNERVTISRAQPLNLPLQCDFVNGNIRAASIDLSNITFDIDRANRTASNIKGINLNLVVFGTFQTLPVERIRLAKNKEGADVLHLEVTSLLPKPAERILGMPATLDIPIPFDKDGLAAPQLSKVFAEAATSTGQSLAGLLAADALKEASKVALFVESNPEWIDSVVQPALREIYKALAGPTEQPLPKLPEVMPPAAATITDNTPSPPAATITDNTPSPPATIEVAPQPNLTNPGDHHCSLTIDGVERSFIVHVPPSFNGKTPMPLVVVLHGHAQDGAELARHTKMDEIANKKGFIAVYPDASVWAGRREWRAWDTGNGLLPVGSKADDVGFLRQIIEKAEKELVIDPKRIYLAGLSNGGMMTYRAAGELSDKLAAIAVVSGAMGGHEPAPSKPLSVLNIHGTDDEIVPHGGLRNVPASLTAVGLPKFKPTSYATDFWKEQNRITNPPLILNNANITERRYINADNGVEVNEYTINGGRHIPANIGAVTETIWQFFESHPKANGITSGTNQTSLEEPFNLTERIKAHAKARGVQGLEMDFGTMLAEVPNVGNGSFSPANSFSQFENKSGIRLDDDVSQFLKSTTGISKTDSRISVQFKSPRVFRLQQGAGPVTLESLTLQNTAFKLTAESGRPIFSDISGINLSVNAFGRNMDVPLRYAAQKVDAQNVPYYLIKTDNPMPRWMRAATIADSQIPVQIRLSDAGEPYLLNQRQIKDATLGYNPVTRGCIDTGTHVYNFYQAPSWSGGAHLVKDAALYGGTGYGAYRLAALRYGMKTRIGAVVATSTLIAPSLIHGIERLID